METIAKVRKIVETKTFAKVNGVTVDLFSASAIITVFDALNERNQAQMATWDVAKMAEVSFRLIEKNREVA